MPDYPHEFNTRPFNRIHGMGIDSRDRLYALSLEKAVLLGFDAPTADEAPTRVVPTHGVQTHLFSLSRDGERAFVTGLLSHTVSLVRPHDASVPPVLSTPGRRIAVVDLERFAVIGGFGAGPVLAGSG
ncbi:hypothetical protein [Streptomyces sp. NPDC058308]|uniref:hypothetical protein n=1 Tax=Streptomyces sp. NPDC058308 TaxID=3346440 RepID=UPI0036EF0310